MDRTHKIAWTLIAVTWITTLIALVAHHFFGASWDAIAGVFLIVYSSILISYYIALAVTE